MQGSDVFGIGLELTMPLLVLALSLNGKVMRDYIILFETLDLLTALDLATKYF